MHKKSILLSVSAFLIMPMLSFAQPKQSRSAALNQRAAAAQRQAETDRVSLQFPTSSPMPEDVVWKRDIYRQLDVMDDKNASMYYPVEPIGRQVNLFTYLFRLVLTNRVPAYTYKLDGNESFEEKDRLAVKDMLDRYGIYYEEKDGALTVADSDVPSAEATRFYIKESVFFDQRTGSFSTRVTALCPILMRGADEFSVETTPYPLFWIKYADAAPWLARLPMMQSNLNNVSNMTADDFFTKNRYEGKIYKTNNLQGKVLANYCDTDSAMTQEQKRIEKELADFEKNIWGNQNDTTAVKEEPKSSRRRRSASFSKAEEQTNISDQPASASAEDSSTASSSRRRASNASEGNAQPTPRVSARRQRN